MGETGVTPGEWRLADGGLAAGHEVSGRPLRAYARTACRCTPRHHVAIRWLPQTEADARVMVAAKALYAALKAIYDADGYNRALAEQAERALQHAHGGPR